MYYSQQPDPQISIVLFVIIISYCAQHFSLSPPALVMTHFLLIKKSAVKQWIKFLPLLLEMVFIYQTASFRKTEAHLCSIV